MKVKRFRKLVSVLVTLSMLLVLLVPLAAPAGAYSVNRADKIVSISDDFDGDIGVKFELREDSKWKNDFANGDVFQLILQDGVNWNSGAATIGGGVATAEIISDQIMEITFNAVTGNEDSVIVPMNIEVDGAIGDLIIEVDPLDSGVSSGTYVFARVSGDNTTARALSVKTIGDRDMGGDIRIEEAAVGSLGNASQSIKLKLPSRFKWDASKTPSDQVNFSGGFSGMTKVATKNVADGEYYAEYEDSTMNIYFDPKSGRNTRGIITVNTPIKADRDARYGEIEVSISGTVADDHDVVIADYADFGIDVTIDSVKDINAGKFNQELKTITIEENVPGTLIKDRDITLIFPDWVKITNAKVRSGGAYASLDTFDGTDNEIDLTIIKSTSGTTTKAKIKLDLEISVEGNRSGDIEMTIEGKRAGMAEDIDLVVGNAVALVTAEADANRDVKIGVQSQEIGDITISELVKEAISDKPNGKIAGNVVLTLPDGVSFSSKPKVEVTEGNLDVKSDNVGLSKDDSVLTIPIKSDSSKASTITVSNVKLTVDRTVPTGDLILKVGGGAIIENQKANRGWLDGAEAKGSETVVDEGEFDTGTAVKVKIANIVTPAPGEVSGTSVFTIGSTTYTVNGVEKSMDVAPYIKGDRTYIPVRFVAQSAGVADNNIIWNEADQSVILIKGDRVVKMIIGSNQLMINGIAVSMDTAPEIVDPGRTMLPLRAVTQALGCVVDWDPATQAASVTL